MALRNNPEDPIHGGDFWFVITGGVDKNESLEETIKREIFEETGIEEIFNIQNLNKVYQYKTYENYLAQEHAFLVKAN